MTLLRAAEKTLLAGIWTGLSLLLLTPFVISPQTLFPYVVGKAVYLQSIIEIVFVLWVLLALMSLRFRPPRSWILILLAVSFGVSVLSACFGVSLQRSLWSNYERMQGMVDQVHWFALALVLVSVVRGSAQWRRLLHLNLAASMGVALLVIAQRFPVDASFIAYLASVDGRPAATLGNPLYLGAYAIVNGLVALGLLARSFVPATTLNTPAPARRKRRERRGDPPAITKRRPSGPWIGRCFTGSAVLLNLWTLLLSGSRGPALGVLAGLIWATFVYLPTARAPRARLAAGGLALALSTAAAVLVILMLPIEGAPWKRDAPVSSPLVERLPPLIQRLMDPYAPPPSSVEARLAAWGTSWRGFVDKPMLGWGPENYVVAFGRQASGVSSEIHFHDNAHNKLIDELVTRGLSGLVSYLAIWLFAFYVVTRAVARSMDERERILMIFVSAALMASFVHLLASPDSATGSLQLVLLLAFVAHLEPVRGIAGFDPSPAKWRHGVRATLAAGALALAGTGLFANQAAYSGASAAAAAIASAENPRSNPTRTRAHFERAIDAFEPLANLPRLLLFDYFGQAWGDLRRWHGEEAHRTLALVEAEASAVLESEPENWRLQAAVARVYAHLAASHPHYADAAKRHRDRARELAPHRREVLALPSPEPPAP